MVNDVGIDVETFGTVRTAAVGNVAGKFGHVVVVDEAATRLDFGKLVRMTFADI